MSSDVKLVRNSDGILRFDYGEPPTPQAGAKPPAQPAPAMNSTRVVIDDSVTNGHPASKALWDSVAQMLNDDLPARAPSSPAAAFTARAEGQPWFVGAEMVTPVGGRRVGGRTAQREPRLEVTVRNGGADAASALLSELGLDGRVVEQRPVPRGNGYSDHRRR